MEAYSRIWFHLRGFNYSRRDAQEYLHGSTIVDYERFLRRSAVYRILTGLPLPNGSSLCGPQPYRRVLILGTAGPF